jgi:hypothetical protein
MSISTDTATRDPLTLIVEWHRRCRRYGRGQHGTTIDVLQIAINTITELRERLDACQERHPQLEATVTGRPQRVGGGVAR